MGRQGVKVANISQIALMPQKWLAYWLLGFHDVYEAVQLLDCCENWLKRRSGAHPLCWGAEGLRSAAATGKPLAMSCAVVVGVGALGGVVAWNWLLVLITGQVGWRCE
jgi:hypothetical protein